MVCFRFGSTSAARHIAFAAALLALWLGPATLAASGTAHASRPGATTINLKALLHNSWDATYRSPFGAVPAGTPVSLRLRTASKGATKVVLYLHTFDSAGRPGTTSHITMTRTARKGYDLWQTTVTPTSVGYDTYTFRVTLGKSAAWYSAPLGRTGGVGTGSRGKKEPQFGFRITVYDKGFTAPSWASDAVIYQIFPDRFYDGDPSNNIPFHSSVPVPDTGSGCPAGSYDTGGYCAYTHNSWSELPESPPHGEDFFGGDLQGIDDKLPYIHSLGVNTLYLNPIFLSPTNHKYDTSDYLTIDPHFGTLDTFKKLVADAKANGIRIILDGVFNHTGDDSIYFNKYGHFPNVGAYQSQQSPYYSWYTFLNWPDSYLHFGTDTSQPQLTETDGVKDFIFRKPDSVAQYWLGQGASGWRLDAADQKSSTWWQEFRTAVKAAYPDDILIAEDTGGPVDPTPMILGNEVDGFMNYNFRDAIVSFFTQGTVGTSGGQASTFVSNLMAMVQDYPLPAQLSSMNLLDSHDTERILTDLGGNKTELKLVAAFQMSWLGIPTVYYGDETGVSGQSDPDDRRTFPWDSQDTNLETYYRKLIAIRQMNPALRDGSVSPLLADNTNRVVAFLRTDSAQQAVVIVNDGTNARTVKVKVPGLSNGTQLTDAISGTTVTVSSGSISVSVPAHEISILLHWSRMPH